MVPAHPTRKSFVVVVDLIIYLKVRLSLNVTDKCDDETEQAFRMLSYWRENDELACGEELLYCLEGFPAQYKAAQSVLQPGEAEVEQPTTQNINNSKT